MPPDGEQFAKLSQGPSAPRFCLAHLA